MDSIAILIIAVITILVYIFSINNNSIQKLPSPIKSDKISKEEVILFNRNDYLYISFLSEHVINNGFFADMQHNYIFYDKHKELNDIHRTIVFTSSLDNIDILLSSKFVIFVMTDAVRDDVISFVREHPECGLLVSTEIYGSYKNELRGIQWLYIIDITLQ